LNRKVLNMKLTAKRVHLFCPGFSEITQLLKSAFPKKERTPVLLLLLGALRKSTHFTAFYDEDTFAGLLYTIENDRYYFVLYLAVNPEMRSGGIGGEILYHAYAHAGDKIIVLNVEPLDSAADNHEQRERRIAFYARHGICETGYGFSMDGVPYNVLASDTETFDPKAYSNMLGGISLGKTD
jgi:GNAT superfamily N-acetyltransferase